MTAVDDEYWESLRSGSLKLQRCTRCSEWRFPPAERCSACLGSAFEWVEAQGTGRLWSSVKFHKQYFGEQGRPTPYSVAMIELDEGPRMISALADGEDLPCDARVMIDFDPARAVDGLPVFRVVPSEHE